MCFLFLFIYANSSALPPINKPTMSPNKPNTLPNISITKTLTKRVGSAASARAALDPVIPTASPHARLHSPGELISLNQDTFPILSYPILF